MSVTCGNKAQGLKDNAMAAHRMGGSNKDKGWSTRTSPCGMANLVNCDDNDLCKNNYFYALSTSSASNTSPKYILPTLHSGITDSGASGFWLLLCHPRTSCQLQPWHSHCQHPESINRKVGSDSEITIICYLHLCLSVFNAFPIMFIAQSVRSNLISNAPINTAFLSCCLLCFPHLLLFRMFITFSALIYSI